PMVAMPASVPGRARVAALVAGALALGVAAPASAHIASLTHSRVQLDGALVHYQILIAPADLAEAAGSTAEGGPDRAAIEAAAPRVITYVVDRIGVEDAGAPCPAEGGTLAIRDDDLVEVRWTARCPAAITVLAIDYALFFDLDPSSEGVIRVEAPDAAPIDTVLRADASRLEWDLSEPPPSGTLAFIRAGIDHILYGFDHIAFVLTLLLAIVIGRGPGGDAGAPRWQPRHLGAALGAMARIVTAFTLAHSITLISASLGWVSVPSRVVESAIALSIAYTAIENVIRPDVRWRFVLTFSFGLLHGLGFARVLEVLLPPDDVIVPLLSFNVGVELGQLVIVAIALPLFWLIALAAGGRAYRRVIMPLLSAALGVLGLLWLAERLLDLRILGF
ncbi:MAG: HupE/UreJ family protein, partial [Myxococcales bacterium]|nr:HupE/UreJ family protein [Myxococcales bacterium]